MGTTTLMSTRTSFNYLKIGMTLPFYFTQKGVQLYRQIARSMCGHTCALWTGMACACTAYKHYPSS